MQIIYQIIYNEHLNFILRNINKWLSPILPKKIRIPPTGTLSIKNSNGEPLKISLNQTCGLGSIIFWRGHLTFEYTSIFIKLIKKIDVFYDVGANIGYYSLLAASENPKVRVVSFEPAIGPSHYLKRNVLLNNFQNVQVESLALSEHEGTIEFYEIKNQKYRYLEHCLAGEGNTGSKTTGRNFHINVVKTKTFDSYVKNNGEINIDLIKIDTEGTEHFILTHASNVLTEMRPIVICETLFNVIEEDLENLFPSYGYECYNHIGDGLVQVKSIVRTVNNGVYNCFFVHPTKKHLIEEFITK